MFEHIVNYIATYEFDTILFLTILLVGYSIYYILI